VARGAHYNDGRRNEDDGNAALAMMGDAMFDQCAATVVG
jgi:hypothetical protein